MVFEKVEVIAKMILVERGLPLLMLALKFAFCSESRPIISENQVYH